MAASTGKRATRGPNLCRTVLCKHTQTTIPQTPSQRKKAAAQPKEGANTVTYRSEKTSGSSQCVEKRANNYHYQLQRCTRNPNREFATNPLPRKARRHRQDDPENALARCGMSGCVSNCCSPNASQQSTQNNSRPSDTQRVNAIPFTTRSGCAAYINHVCAKVPGQLCQDKLSCLMKGSRRGCTTP